MRRVGNDSICNRSCLPATDRRTATRRLLAPGLVLAGFLTLVPFQRAQALSLDSDPSLQHWFAGATDTQAGEVLIPITSDAADTGFYFLNVVADFNQNGSFAAFGSQAEWVSENVPVPILPSSDVFLGNFFGLTAPPVSGPVNLHVLLSRNPIDPSLQPSTGWDGSLPSSPGSFVTGDFTEILASFDRGTGSSLGPTGGGGWPFLPVIGGERKLPQYLTQPAGSNECYITSVAMSLYWMKEKYPDTFKNLPGDPATLLAKMKQSSWWKDNGLIPWADLAAFKRWILDQYGIKGVRVEEWSKPDNAYTWVLDQYAADQDIEFSIQDNGGGGHSMIVTGTVQWNAFNWLKVVDPLEATKNGKPVEKLIQVSGLDTSYGGGSTVRAIDAESVPEPATLLLFAFAGILLFGARGYALR